ncbi:MAG: transposase [Verrucomicrobiae bacterium]|nr:transposase [Verrucomicrobiae bacterium]
MVRSGCPWRALPEVLGPWQTVYSRWRLWCEKGFWSRATGILSWNQQVVLRFVDASHPMSETTVESLITPLDQTFGQVCNAPKPFFIDIYQRECKWT